MIGGWDISCEIALKWMPLDLTDDKSTLVQVMAWCHQAPSHYLSQCWPRSLSPYGVTRPQWVNGHDSQFPIGIVASGSRDWSTERQLTSIAHCKLSQGAAEKSRVTWLWLSKHKHDWTGPADCASVQPMTTCQSRATESPKHKSLRDWSHMVHRPRLILVSRNHA